MEIRDRDFCFDSPPVWTLNVHKSVKQVLVLECLEELLLLQEPGLSELPPEGAAEVGAGLESGVTDGA